jgi:2-polyprenyl-3-methyl-5-hydroxy-6-metoxy-1,4-benzoquinol methylase
MLKKLIRAPRAVLSRLGLSKRTWKDVETFDELWKQRIQLMASFIPKEAKTILDVGCGKMWLREFIPATVKYSGIDYVARGEGCIVCDLNRAEFPEGSYDVIFVSGCLEYVEDYRWFLRTVAQRCRMRVLLSYCVLDHFNNLPQRRTLAWVSDLTEAMLLEESESAGLKLVAKVEAPSADRVYVFEPKAAATA